MGDENSMGETVLEGAGLLLISILIVELGTLAEKRY